MDHVAFPAHTVETFLVYDGEVLKQKRFMANLAIKAAKEGLRDGDERAPKALEYYLEERKLINQALHSKMYGEDGPPSQGVQLQTLQMAGDASVNRAGETWSPLAEFLKLFTEERKDG